MEIFQPRHPDRMVPFLIRLSNRDLYNLEILADKQGTKKSILVRTAVKEFLNRRNFK